jgi:hypothetical protein
MIPCLSTAVTHIATVHCRTRWFSTMLDGEPYRDIVSICSPGNLITVNLGIVGSLSSYAGSVRMTHTSRQVDANAKTSLANVPQNSSPEVLLKSSGADQRIFESLKLSMPVTAHECMVESFPRGWPSISSTNMCSYRECWRSLQPQKASHSLHGDLRALVPTNASSLSLSRRPGAREIRSVIIHTMNGAG